MNPLAADLDHILAHTEGLWEELRGQRIFITGGTGFFGCWLLESFAWANEKLGLNASAVVLSRNPEAFAKKAPHLAVNPAVQFHTGDVRNFDFLVGEFSYVIHAANEDSTKTSEKNLLRRFEIALEGTRHTLEFARQCGARKFLLTSSGAVYGRQPSAMTHIPETYNQLPNSSDPFAALGIAKRAAEMLCILYTSHYGLETKIARCFAFVGPYLQLDVHYAIGNFIRDALRGGPIQVNGDGTPFRSYLYASDLAVWLWTILFRGQSTRAYNVGSENDLPIREVAQTVAGVFQPALAVTVAQAPTPGKPEDRYVPMTSRARTELDLHTYVQLSDSIRRTVQWSMR